MTHKNNISIIEKPYKNLTKSDLEDIFQNDFFKTPPMHHQLVSMAFALDGRDKLAIFSGIGTGKSYTSLNLGSLWKCKKILVISPKTVLVSWEDQIKLHTDFSYVTLTGTKEERLQKLKLKRDIYLLNFEGLLTIFRKKVQSNKNKSGYRMVLDDEFILKQDFDYIIVDESHRIKDPTAIQTVITTRLSLGVSHMVLLTGTPIARDERDLFAPYYALDHGETLGENYWQFMRKYFNKGFFDWTLKPNSSEIILEAIATKTIRYDREECISLPPKIYEKRNIEMSDEQLEIQTKLLEGYRIQLEKGELAEQNILTQTIKLAQISGGFLIGTEGIVKLKSNPKLEALKELLPQIEGKCIIFHRFQQEGRDIAELCDKMKYKYRSLRGEIKNKDKEFHDFVEDGSIKFLIANQLSGGSGLNIQQAKNIIFYSNEWSAVLRSQSEGRIFRTGQTESCLFIDLIVDGSIDERVLESLEKKQDLSSKILDWIKNYGKKR